MDDFRDQQGRPLPSLRDRENTAHVNSSGAGIGAVLSSALGFLWSSPPAADDIGEETKQLRAPEPATGASSVGGTAGNCA